MKKLLYFFLVFMIVSCKENSEKQSIVEADNSESSSTVTAESASNDGIDAKEMVSSDLINSDPLLWESSSPNAILKTLSFTTEALENVNLDQPITRDFTWKWIECTASKMPTSPASTNVRKAKEFLTPWYDPINVYILSNAPGTVGSKSEEIYFVDYRPNNAGNYHVQRHSTLTELKCGIWGNLVYPDQAKIYIGDASNKLELTITQVNQRFYTIKATSMLTGKPIEVWLWKV